MWAMRVSDIPEVSTEKLQEWLRLYRNGVAAGAPVGEIAHTLNQKIGVELIRRGEPLSTAGEEV